MRNLFLLLSLSAFLFACKSNKDAANSTAVALEFSKSQCMGKCPAYELKVLQNGSATLNVIANLELEPGSYTCANCDALQIQLILQKAKEIGFKNFEDKYDPGVMDLPSTTTVIDNKKVINLLDAPQELIDLEEQIHDAYIKGHVWEKAE